MGCYTVYGSSSPLVQRALRHDEELFFVVTKSPLVTKISHNSSYKFSNMHKKLLQSYPLKYQQQLAWVSPISNQNNIIPFYLNFNGNPHNFQPQILHENSTTHKNFLHISPLRAQLLICVSTTILIKFLENIYLSSTNFLWKFPTSILP